MTETQLLNELFDRLWPIPRSIAGSGFRKSLDILSEIAPFERLCFASGSKAFDWTVPEEWNPVDAYIVGPDGKKRASFQENNLHLVSHSVPFRGRLPLSKLKEHLHSLPDQPNAIPYLTSYYKKRWGFCLTHNELTSLPEGEYEVVVDTELKSGELVVGEAVIPGKTSKEVLLSTYLCHPSLANNELSGPLALALLYARIAKKKKRNYTYRFVMSAETIGTICYLSRKGTHLKENVRAGFQLTCVGDSGAFTLKKSRRGNSLADTCALDALSRKGKKFNVVDFDPGNGSDERQYCSPAFNLPFASLMRTMYSRYPEYHTSLDNKDFISLKALQESVDLYEEILDQIDECRFFRSTNPQCEPQLGKRGLYPEIGTTTELESRLKAIMWVMNFSDGEHDLSMISQKSGLPLPMITAVAADLAQSGLIAEF